MLENCRPTEKLLPDIVLSWADKSFQNVLWMSLTWKWSRCNLWWGTISTQEEPGARPMKSPFVKTAVLMAALFSLSTSLLKRRNHEEAPPHGKNSTKFLPRMSAKTHPHGTSCPQPAKECMLRNGCHVNYAF